MHWVKRGSRRQKQFPTLQPRILPSQISTGHLEMVLVDRSLFLGVSPNRQPSNADHCIQRPPPTNHILPVSWSSCKVQLFSLMSTHFHQLGHLNPGLEFCPDLLLQGHLLHFLSRTQAAVEKTLSQNTGTSPSSLRMIHLPLSFQCIHSKNYPCSITAGKHIWFMWNAL